MTSTFHLAIPAGDLAETKRFYCDVLGCTEGNQEAGRWVDINFWGNELERDDIASERGATAWRAARRRHG